MRVAWRLQDSPEPEIVTVAGDKRDAVGVFHIVEPRGDSLCQSPRPGILQHRSVKVSRPRLRPRQ